MGVGDGYVAPSAGLGRSQGIAVMGRGSGLTRVGASAGLGGFDCCGLAVPVGACIGVLRLPVHLVSSGWGVAWRFAADAGWVSGLNGGAAGWGVRRVVLLGGQGS